MSIKREAAAIHGPFDDEAKDHFMANVPFHRNGIRTRGDYNNIQRRLYDAPRKPQVQIDQKYDENHYNTSENQFSAAMTMQRRRQLFSS